jgi:electron transfer flavoprotein alpha subunit
MKVLVIAEHDNLVLKPATLQVVSAARKLGDDISVVVCGHNCADVAAAASHIDGVNRVFLADHESLAQQLAEAVAPLLIKMANGVAAVVAAASTNGKNLLPRVAAMLDVAQLSEVIAIVDHATFVRPIYAGNVLATMQSSDPVKVLTVRASSFAAAATGTVPCAVEAVEVQAVQTQSRFISVSHNTSTRPELGAARVVISGGRGLGSAENFKLLDQVADKLGAAIGASRAAVDAGYVGNDLQVGQTGKIVAPELYISAGISGAIQHLAGMKDSKVIVAINKDPEAPIFQVADYGLVADLFTALPELAAAL